MAVVTTTRSTSTVVVDRARTAAIVQNRPQAASVPDQRTAATVDRRPAVVGVSSPGVQGRAGQDGGTTEARIAATDLGGHRIVRSTSGTAVGYADCTNAAHGDDTLGMTIGAALAGDAVQVQARGPVSFNGWAWTPGEPVFLGASGQPTQAPPAGAFEQVIGYAEDATTIHLRIAQPIYED